MSTQTPIIKGNVTAEEVKRAVSHRIHNGLYPIGSQLPSVRDMAQELGANRNTISKAYRALEHLGILEATSSRKAFLVATKPHIAGLTDNFQDQALDVIWQAMAAGLSRRQVLDNLTSIVTQVYGGSDIKLKFLECNEYDSTALAAELAQMSGVYVEPGLLDELDHAPDLAQTYDLMITTFHHLAEVDRAFEQLGIAVLGVDTRPSSEVLLALARLRSSRVAVICGAENTIWKLTHTILGYQPTCSVECALVDDERAVKRLLSEDATLVITHSCIEQIADLTSRQPDIVVEFRIDESSLAPLKQHIQAVRLERYGAGPIGQPMHPSVRTGSHPRPSGVDQNIP